MELAFRLQALRALYGSEAVFRADRMPSETALPGKVPYAPRFGDGFRELLKRLLRDQLAALPNRCGLDDLLDEFLAAAGAAHGGFTDNQAAFRPLHHLAEDGYRAENNRQLLWRGGWDLRQRVRQHLPIELLQAAYSAHVFDGHAPPAHSQWEIPTSDPSLQRLLSRGLSDNHLHLAAAIPFWELLPAALHHIGFPGADPRVRLFNERGWIGDGPPARSAPSPSRRRQPPPGPTLRQTFRNALLLLKALLLALHRFRAPMVDHDAGFAGFLERRMPRAPDGEGPDRVARWLESLCARVFDGDTRENGLPVGPSWRSVWPWLAGLDRFPVFDGASLLRETYGNFRWLRRPRRDAGFAFAWLQAVRLLCWLYRSCRHGPGFYEFEGAFPAVDCLIEAAGLEDRGVPYRVSDGARPRPPSTSPTGSDPLVALALRSLFRDPYLRHVELRHPVRLPDRRSRLPAALRARRFSAENLERRLEAQYAALADVREDDAGRSEGSRTAVFPIHLLRKADEPVGRAGPDRREPFRPGFLGLWLRMEKVAELLIRMSRRISTIPSRWPMPIDVASNEDRLPNWVVAAAFAEIRARYRRHCGSGAPPLTFQAHAGEHFHQPLHGLRRLWETLAHLGPLRRIGHGLALTAAGPWPRHLRRGEYLDDLVWAATRLRRLGHDAELAAALEDRALELWRERERDDMPALFPVWEAYTRRFDREWLARAGILRRRSGLSDVYDYAGNPRGRPSEDSGAQRLLRSLAGAADTERIVLEDGEIRRLREAHEALAPTVFEKIRRDQVVIECCPSSNLSIAGYPGYGAHPLFALAESGCLVTLNSDDPGIFQAALSEEYCAVWETAADHPGLGATDRRKEWLETIRYRGEDLSRFRLYTPLRRRL